MLDRIRTLLGMRKAAAGHLLPPERQTDDGLLAELVRSGWHGGLDPLCLWHLF